MKKIVIKALFYILGLAVLALGISLTIISGLGTSPFDALLVGLYHTVGLTVGSWEFIIGALLVLINALIERKIPNVLAIATAFVTGVGIDLWLYLLQETFFPSHLWSQIGVFILAILCSGLGVATYLQAKFAPSPIDESMLVINKYTGIKVATARNLIMLVFFIVAFLIKGPIGIGTIILVFSGGPTIAWFMVPMQVFSKKLLESDLPNDIPKSNQI